MRVKTDLDCLVMVYNLQDVINENRYRLEEKPLQVADELRRLEVLSKLLDRFIFERGFNTCGGIARNSSNMLYGITLFLADNLNVAVSEVEKTLDERREIKTNKVLDNFEKRWRAKVQLRAKAQWKRLKIVSFVLILITLFFMGYPSAGRHLMRFFNIQSSEVCNNAE